jgi:hypothetical protein
MRTSPKRLLAAGLLGVLIGVVPVALAQSSNSEVGTWKLNVGKSKFGPGTALKSGTAKIEGTGAGAKFTLDGVDADGTMRHWEYITNYDGKDNPVTGNAVQGDMVARTRINATTTKTVWKKGGKITVTQTSVVSGDGKTRTVTGTGTNALGQPMNNVTVWDKQ